MPEILKPTKKSNQIAIIFSPIKNPFRKKNIEEILNYSLTKLSKKLCDDKSLSILGFDSFSSLRLCPMRYIRRGPVGSLRIQVALAPVVIADTSSVKPFCTQSSESAAEASANEKIKKKTSTHTQTK